MRVLELQGRYSSRSRAYAQDSVGHGLGAVAALVFVADDFLNHLQVDDGHHADRQVRVLGNVVWAFDRAVQAFIRTGCRWASRFFRGWKVPGSCWARAQLLPALCRYLRARPVPDASF